MDEKEGIRQVVKAWQDAAPELEAIRRREIADADNVHLLALLEDAFDHAALFHCGSRRAGRNATVVRQAAQMTKLLATAKRVQDFCDGLTAPENLIIPVPEPKASFSSTPPKDRLLSPL